MYNTCVCVHTRMHVRVVMLYVLNIVFSICNNLPFIIFIIIIIIRYKMYNNILINEKQIARV